MIAWYGHPGWGGCGPGGWIWIALMVLFWGSLLAAAVYLIWRRPAPAATSGAGAGPAEMTLAERYTPRRDRRRGVPAAPGGAP
jgi:hypothetical protein